MRLGPRQIMAAESAALGSVADIFVVKNVLGASGLFVVVRPGSVTAAGVITLTARPIIDSAGTITANGPGLINQNGTGAVDSTHHLVGNFHPDLKTASTGGVGSNRSFIDVPYIYVRLAQAATAGSIVVVEAYPVYEYDDKLGTAGYSDYPLFA